MATKSLEDIHAEYEAAQSAFLAEQAKAEKEQAGRTKAAKNKVLKSVADLEVDYTEQAGKLWQTFKAELAKGSNPATSFLEYRNALTELEAQRFLSTKLAMEEHNRIAGKLRPIVDGDYTQMFSSSAIKGANDHVSIGYYKELGNAGIHNFTNEQITESRAEYNRLAAQANEISPGLYPSDGNGGYLPVYFLPTGRGGIGKTNGGGIFAERPEVLKDASFTTYKPLTEYNGELHTTHLVDTSNTKFCAGPYSICVDRALYELTISETDAQNKFGQKVLDANKGNADVESWLNSHQWLA